MSTTPKITRSEDPAAIQRAMSSKPEKTPSNPNSQTARKINNLANTRLPKAYVKPSIQSPAPVHAPANTPIQTPPLGKQVTAFGSESPLIRSKSQ